MNAQRPLRAASVAACLIAFAAEAPRCAEVDGGLRYWDGTKPVVLAAEEIPDPFVPTAWFPAVNQNCQAFCAARGAQNLPDLSPQGFGMRCTSGENVAALALPVVPFVFGCWPNCSPHGHTGAASVGGRCYGPSQKKDNDNTDRTVGCHCGVPEPSPLRFARGGKKYAVPLVPTNHPLASAVRVQTPAGTRAAKKLFVQTWFPAPNANCPGFCAGLGKVNAPDAGVQGFNMRCTSGENIAAGAVVSVPYIYGCWPNCSPHGHPGASSVGGRCYGPGQKQDGDNTDRTVGCHCQ